MSVNCRLGHAPQFLRVLQTLRMTKDSWMTCVFTKDVIILHIAGEDHSCTASATIPAAMFLEYTCVGSPKAMLHVGSLLDALQMAGPLPNALRDPNAAAYGVKGSTTVCTISFPASDQKVLVQLSESRRSISSLLATRPVRERLLDLRFSDALVVHRATVRGDVLREMVQDLYAFQCTQVRVECGSTNLRLVGLESVLGKKCCVSTGTSADVVFGIETSDVNIKPRYHLHHLMAACGLSHRGGGGGHRGSGGAADTAQYAPWNAAWDATGSVCELERLTVTVNAERQLCVMHQGADTSAPSLVQVVIQPLCEVDLIA